MTLWYVSNVSTFPNTFALVLDSNLHDLNGTNPGWRCFQQNCHGVIFVQKQKFSEWPETLQRLFLEIIKNTGESIKARGPHPVHEGGRRACPLGAPPALWAPWCSTDLNSNSIYSRSGRKNQREGFIAFYDTELPPSPNLSREGWSGVRSGLRRGESVAVVIINHPPSPISWCSPPCVSNSIVGLLDGGWMRFIM